jgi:hypothetical protein
MNELRDWLKDADPVGNEPPLPDTEFQGMRRVVIDAAGEQPLPSGIWRHSWATACVALVVVIAVGVGRWWSASEPVPTATTERLVVPETATRRQVQLIAPGGTRVIWIFNSDFEMKERGK